MTTPETDPWERHAGWWQEGFTDGADPEYTEQMIPLALEQAAGAKRVLDVGTGEGQIARALSAVGHEVVGIDPTWNQIRVAASRGGRATYARAAAGGLPVGSGSIDAVVACLVFEHIVDFDKALAEVARVLRPGGLFLWFLNHPLLQTPGSGWIDDQIIGEQYWRVGPYLRADSRLEEISPGVHLPYVHRPLNEYVNAMVDFGLALDLMLEPPPPAGFLAAAPEYEGAASIPRLLFLRGIRT